MTPDELRKLAGAPATEIWIGTVRAALRHAADLADAAHDVRDENERLRADLASVHQAITDSENQPSQYGTVTLAMYEKAEAERDALAKALLECDAVARARGDKYGLCDSIDNGGTPYPSQWLADLLAKARAALAQIEQERSE